MLDWIANWYISQCDGRWEHFYGIKIDTLDNSGWGVEIDLSDTDLIDKPFTNIEKDISDSDWMFCRINNNKFEGSGDTKKLNEILEVFKTWVES